MLKSLRVLLASLMLLGVSVLFLDVTGAAQAWLGWMAKVQLLPAVLAVNVGVVVLMVVLTLVVGRVYCSVVCPMGVMQDVFSWIAGKCWPNKNKRKFGRFSYMNGKIVTVLRLIVLAVFLIALVLGGGVIVQLLAPYSSFGRIATMILRPIAVCANNMAADWAAAHESYAFYSVEVWTRSLPVLITAVITLAIVGLMAILGGRLYCNSICPVGTILGYLAKRSLFRIQIDNDKCKHCGLCERKCKAMCIDAKHGIIDTTRCVDCFDCLDSCKHNALHYGLAHKSPSDCKIEPNSEKNEDGVSSRRTFLATAATMTAAAALKAQEKTVDGGYAVIVDKIPFERETRIVPPGAISLKHLQQHCTGCQLCVSACPNNVLRPSSDMHHFMQPELSFEKGHCRPECHACSDVCPAGAIIKLGSTHDESMARKANTKIGRAVVILENCIAYSNGTNCGNCSRQCPSQAIAMVPKDPDDRRSIKIPTVNDERCIGCGACENLCPVRPFSAIHVEGIEVQREL